MAAITVVLGLGLFLLGLVALIRPLPKLHLPTRARGGMALVLGIVLIGIGVPSEQPTSQESSGQPAASSIEPPTVTASEPEPASPEEKVRRGVRTKYGEPVDVTVEGRRVLVSFNIADNLTENMIRRGAQMHVKNILEGINASGFDFEHVTVQGSFPMIDRFGNSEKIVVVNIGYDRSTVDRINWPNMLTDNIYVVADRATIHPTFRAQQ